VAYSFRAQTNQALVYIRLFIIHGLVDKISLFDNWYYDVN